jgi:tetratricopeptide (TPR) repeat protein
MPTLSLCLIAKDEATMLPACLASVVGVVDQLVVVDTGSSDATAQLAREAGATVVEHAWQDDFAAARNAGLAACTGNWVLVLDADERLAPGVGGVLRRSLEKARFDCGLLPLHNASSLDAPADQVLSGTARRGDPILLPRLLRRTPDLAYRGVVHESIGHWLVEGGRKTARIEAPIIHLGAVPSYRQARGKDARNLALLERRCQQDPGDPVGWTYLARERFRADDRAGAREAALQGWTALEAVARPGGPNPSFVPLADMWVQVQLASGDSAGALASLEQCAAWGSTHPNLAMLEGRVRYALALEQPEQAAQHLAGAEAALGRALGQRGQAFTDETLPGATGWESRYHRALVRLSVGRPGEALADLEACLAEQPTHAGALLARAEAVLAQGQPQQALKLLEPLLQAPGPDAWTLAAMACDLLGSPGDVVSFVKQALSRLEDGFVALHRAPALDELRVAAGLYQGQCPKGPGQSGRVADLVARRPSPPAVAMVDSAGLHRLVTNLIRAERGAALAALLEPRAEEVLPGIGYALGQIFDQLGLNIEDDGEPDFIFIGGAGRSGTTLFRAMLHAHPRIHCGPEAKLVSTLCRQRDLWMKGMGRDLAEAGVTQQLMDRSVRAFLETLLRGLAPAGVRVAEKTPHNLLHTAFLGQIFPRARFIHVIRDGRSVAASLVRQAWIDPATGKPLAYCETIPNAATYWREIITGVRQQAPAVPGRYLEVRYERLVTEPETVMREVLAFLGEAWDPAVLEHQRADVALSSLESSTEAVKAAVNTGAVEKWKKNLSERELSQVVAVAGGLLAELGYVD